MVANNRFSRKYVLTRIYEKKKNADQFVFAYDGSLVVGLASLELNYLRDHCFVISMCQLT